MLKHGDAGLRLEHRGRPRTEDGRPGAKLDGVADDGLARGQHDGRRVRLRGSVVDRGLERRGVVGDAVELRSEHHRVDLEEVGPVVPDATVITEDASAAMVQIDLGPARPSTANAHKGMPRIP